MKVDLGVSAVKPARWEAVGHPQLPQHCRSPHGFESWVRSAASASEKVESQRFWLSSL